MGRWADLETQVLAAVGDSTSTEARSWLLDAARRLNGAAQFLTSRVSIGTTTIGTATYTVSTTFIDLVDLRIGTGRYDRISPQEMDSIEGGFDYNVSDPFVGVFSIEQTSTGGTTVTVKPTPTANGVAIQGREVLSISSPTWASDDPPLPVDFDAAIRHGAISIGLALKDEDTANAEWHESRFLAAVDALKERKSRAGTNTTEIRQLSPGRWDDMVAQVRGALPDAKMEDVRRWLLDSARRLNAQSGYLTAEVTIGDTVAGTASYLLGETFVDLAAVRVDDVPFDRITPTELWEIEGGASYSIRPGYGGLYAADWTTAGLIKIQLVPTPDTDGLSIHGREVIMIPTPVNWVTESPPLPVDMDQAITQGAIATGLGQKPDMLDAAQWHESRLNDAVPALRQRKNSRIGSGGVRIRLGNIGR